jgi:hypothetical protein
VRTNSRNRQGRLRRGGVYGLQTREAAISLFLADAAWGLMQ